MTQDRPRIGHLIVPADLPGITWVPTWDHLGLRASNTHDVIYADVRLPLDAFVEIPRGPDGVYRDPAAMTRSAGVGNTALYVGVARAARQAFAEFAAGAGRWTPRPGTRGPAAFPLSQQRGGLQVGDAFVPLVPCRRAGFQGEVPDFADAAEGPVRLRGLFRGRVEAVFVGAHHHLHHIEHISGYPHAEAARHAEGRLRRVLPGLN
jgi:hypothetical protein